MTGEARVSGVSLEDTTGAIRRTLEQQQRRWGSPLLNHMIYARRPTIFAGARGMWQGLHDSGLLGPVLTAIVNRRVALLNNCEF